jgi:uncharacterized protein (TIGR03032 family)
MRGVAARRTAPTAATLDGLWAHHHAEWRHPAQVVSQWRQAAEVDPRLLQYRVRGEWWSTLAAAELTLLITREYEHLVVAMSVSERGRPTVTYQPLPHPSGLIADRAHGLVYIASTRNPNQIYELAPVRLLPRRDARADATDDRPLIPTRSRFLPGCLYLHDLELIGDVLHGNAVGMNAVVRLDESGGASPVWWPRSIETPSGPFFERNHLQLNSIAAGPDLETSYFSASTPTMSRRRPGHLNFPVDRRGVIFSGATREPIVGGLTRPHSARLRDGVIWVDNSGYGELGRVVDGTFEPVVRLPGWTRGLSFAGDIAFVGTSRVIPRFRRYAPGLDQARSECAIHAIDVRSGKMLGAITWPMGNQIFAIDWLPTAVTSGFAFRYGRSASTRARLFFAFEPVPPRASSG